MVENVLNPQIQEAQQKKCQAKRKKKKKKKKKMTPKHILSNCLKSVMKMGEQVTITKRDSGSQHAVAKGLNYPLWLLRVK